MKLKIPAIIREDFLRKLVAMVFAVLAFIYVKRELHKPHTFHNIRVQLEVRDPFVVEDEESVGKLKVMVRGSDNALQKLTSADIEVLVKVPEAVDSGIIEMPVTVNDVKVPFGVRVVEVRPSYISVNLDKKVEKWVNVNIKTKDQPPQHLKETRRTLNQEKVLIKGPSRQLAKISQLSTVPIPLSLIKSKGEVTCDTKVDRSELSPLVKVLDSDLVARFMVVPREGEAYVSMKLRTIGEPAEGLELVAGELPVIKQLGLVGPLSEISKIKPQNPPRGLFPFVDLSGLKEVGEHMLEVKFWSDKDLPVKAVYAIPTKVKIILRKKALPEVIPDAK